MHTTDPRAEVLSKARASGRMPAPPLPPDPPPDDSPEAGGAANMTSEERRREVAAILAAGLLRLRTHLRAAMALDYADMPRRMAAMTDIPSELARAEVPACAPRAGKSAGRHAVPTESSESARKALGFPAPTRTDCPDGLAPHPQAESGTAQEPLPPTAIISARGEQAKKR